MVTTAGNLPAGGLKTLWAQSFGDGIDYITLFFTKRYDPSQTLVEMRGGEPAAMLFLLDMELLEGSQAEPGYYLYAACTHPQYRNMGIMSGLLKEARRFASERGKLFIALKPAEPSLYGYYSRYGYSSFFYEKHVELGAEAKEEVSLTSLTPQAMRTAQQESLRRHGGVRWPEEALAYALEENAFTNGRAAAVESEAGICTFFYRYQNGRLHLSECLGNLSLLPKAVCALGEESACAALPTWFPGEGKTRPNGMLLWLSDTDVTQPAQTMRLNFTLG